MAIVDTHLSPPQVERLAADGVDLLQLRDLSATPGELLSCAQRLVRAIDGSLTKLLVNTRADIAIAARAHGVHLRAHPRALTPADVRSLYQQQGLPSPYLSISCHTLEDVARAQTLGADLALFGPVFEKRLTSRESLAGVGLDRLAEACRLAAPMPVLALGGVTAENAASCLSAGAAGIAAIRMFR